MDLKELLSEGPEISIGSEGPAELFFLGGLAPYISPISPVGLPTAEFLEGLSSAELSLVLDGLASAELFLLGGLAPYKSSEFYGPA